MTTVGHIIDAIEEYRPALTVIDEGGLGYGVLDRLTEQKYKVRGVNFGWKAKNPVMWGNKGLRCGEPCGIGSDRPACRRTGC